MKVRDKADDAFAVHSALLRMEVAEPKLRENPEWMMVRFDVFERFIRLMDGQETN